MNILTNKEINILELMILDKTGDLLNEEEFDTDFSISHSENIFALNHLFQKLEKIKKDNI